jgi:hypothetical protein
VDIIITTALIPGKPAPKLITAEMVQSMKPGSVIVDMAAEQGGNCELTEPGEAVVKHGVTIIGYTDLASRLAKQSSTLYATNLFRLTEELCKTKDGVINVNMEDDAIRGLTVIKEGEVTWPPRRPSCRPHRRRSRPPRRRRRQGPRPRRRASRWRATLAIMFGVGARLFWFVGANAPAAFLSHFTVFVLACFVGYMVVWNVTPALHTPLMSVTNAISSDHRHRRPGADRAAAGRRRRRRTPDRWLAVAASRSRPSTCSAASRSPAHAGDVPQVRRRRNMSKSGNRLLHRRNHPLHPQPGRAVQPRDLAPRQPVRHDRHDHRRAGHGVRAARHAAGIPWIIGAMVVGGAIGLYAAKKVR